MLVVLNGAPGVGKNTLADRWADEHALALVIDIDDLRRHLGQWDATEASRQIARDLSVALAREHLLGGHDVIVPQFVGRRDFVERLRGVADDAEVQFVEVVLTDDSAAIVERFRRRRAELSRLGVRHPEADLNDDAIAAEVETANDGLRRDALTYGLTLIHLGAGIESGYRALCDATQSAST